MWNLKLDKHGEQMAIGPSKSRETLGEIVAQPAQVNPSARGVVCVAGFRKMHR